ncbi:MAG: hypothetical protein EXR64_00900 [Dehalococcoidia bacterium]|nr:hypothetical protein [Dehalococcoidia bacterium]
MRPRLARIATVAAILVLSLTLLPARPAHAQVVSFTPMPNTAPAVGGVGVTLIGGGFLPGASVYFGTVPSPQVTYIDSGIMSAIVPPGSGTVMLTILNANGLTSQGYPFTYTGVGSTAVLSVTAIAPNVGAAAGGTTVTVIGTGFVAPVTVIFGGVAAVSTTLVSPTMITAVAPAGVIGASPLLVSANGQSVTFTGFSYGATSSSSIAITSVSPNTTPLGGGTLVQITGSGFVAGATVAFGSVFAANPIVYGSTLITAVAPAGPSGSTPVIVRNHNSEAAVFTGFAYGAATTTTGGTQPSVTSVAPNSGSSAGGSGVTITGSGFSSPATVTFGGIPATNVSVVNAGLITATAPPNAVGAVTVLVSGGNGQVGGLTAGFTYIVAIPQVTGVTPTSALPQGGTALTITGSGFVPGATVTVGGATATGVTVVSPTQITATTPAGPAGAAHVLVINPGGAISGLANAFSYSTTAPATPVSGPIALISLSPATGPLTGGTSISIGGSGFVNGATVTVGGTVATAGVVSPTQIVALTPPSGTASSVAVTVTNPGGVSATMPGAFTYALGATTPPPPPVPTTPPAPAAPLVPAGGSGLFVFKGGSNADLVAVSGCNASTAVFWTTDTHGAWIGYLPSVPIAIVNASWNALFPNGIPANTAIFARCAP